jgi:hypothetical protein
MRSIKLKIKYLFPVNIIIFLFGQLKIASATTLVSNIPCIESGTCKLDDIMRVAINVSNIVLGVVGALSLLAFIYGGATWLISGGSRDRVNQGKKIILGAVIGLFIVFTSYMIISFVAATLGVTEDIFNPGWQGSGSN